MRFDVQRARSRLYKGITLHGWWRHRVGRSQHDCKQVAPQRTLIAIGDSHVSRTTIARREYSRAPPILTTQKISP